MKPDRMVHDWQPYPGGLGHWVHVPGKPSCMVRTKPCPGKGYLWQHGKQVGFAPTVEQAKEWAETAREFWPRGLPTD